METKGPCKSASANAIIGAAKIAPRPQAAQIVGTIVFARSAPYDTCEAFR